MVMAMAHEGLSLGKFGCCVVYDIWLLQACLLTKQDVSFHQRAAGWWAGWTTGRVRFFHGRRKNPFPSSFEKSDRPNI